MERLTHYRVTPSYKSEYAEPDDGVDNGDIYDRLAELEDKLESGELIEVKPLDMPAWEEVKDSRKRIICDLGHWSISKLGYSIYGLELGKGICAQFAMTEEGYIEARKWIDRQRKKLIKELCGE